MTTHTKEHKETIKEETPEQLEYKRLCTGQADNEWLPFFEKMTGKPVLKPHKIVIVPQEVLKALLFKE